MINIFEEINELIIYAIENNLISSLDEIFIRNEILSVLNIDYWEDVNFIEGSKNEDSKNEDSKNEDSKNEDSKNEDSKNIKNKENIKSNTKEIPEFPETILRKITQFAVENKIIEDTLLNRDLFDTKIMGILTPLPSKVIEIFERDKKESIFKATDNYYLFSQKTNYIRTDRVSKNIGWEVLTNYGNLEITINLSKPEIDPKDIAKQQNKVSNSYPKCLLCYESVGYRGNMSYPARQNHRIIPLKLNKEEWFFQYSPYTYYNEHCIIFSKKHTPMDINKNTFIRLVEFSMSYPHYFIGSNTDLPIVGGSILSHEHYQGGRHEFPMLLAKEKLKINFKDFESVEASIINWPMAVIKLKSKNSQDIIELSNKIYGIWRNYSDNSSKIISHTDETPHNAVTPICRMKDSFIEMFIVLRNNRTDEENPYGMFHASEKYHNIKKENIGLIEVMGLAILPGRLKKEMETIKEYLKEPNFIEKINNDSEVLKHLEWVKSLNLDEINLELEIGTTFSKILGDCNIFKYDITGENAFKKFIESVNAKN